MLRELREDDADAVADLFRTAFGEAWPIDTAEIVSWIRNQELKPEWLRVLEENGRVVGSETSGSRTMSWRSMWPPRAAG